MREIRGYHVHVYCSREEIPLAQSIREAMLKELAIIEGAGPVRNRPVGPHPLPMFEAWFPTEGLDLVVEWITKHRNGLSVLIHPMTGDDYADHTEGARWIGEKLELNLEVLKGSDQ